MPSHCVDEQRSMRAQTPAAQRVAAARGHLLRCSSSKMEGIEFVAGTSHLAPWRSQRGPRDFCHGLLGSGRKYSELSQFFGRTYPESIP